MGEIKKHKKTEQRTFEVIKAKVHELANVKDLIKSDTNALSVHRKDHGPEYVNDELMIYIGAFQMGININHKLSAFQIKELINVINKRFYFLSMTEIVFIFERAKAGVYQIPKFAINIHDIVAWFEIYTDERVKEFETARYENHKKLKSGDPLKEVFTDTDGKTKVRQKQQFDKQVVDALSSFKKRMPDKEKDFEQFKEEGKIEFVDNSNNEELKRIQEEAIRKYGPSGQRD
jgi:hypothetical protein